MFDAFTKTITIRIGMYLCSMVLAALTFGIHPSTVFSYEERPDFEGGSISGTVVLNGTVPTPKRYNLVLFPDPFYCGRISDGKGWRIAPFIKSKLNEGIPGVIVYLKNIQFGKPLRLHKQIIRAKNCAFSPYITRVSHGQTLIFENWDPVPHDIEVFEFSDRGGKFLFHQPLQRNPKLRKSDFLTKGLQTRHLPGHGVTHQMLTTGPLVFRCSFHEYMEAWGFVVNHPYFSMTGKSGEFTITNIPPGKYHLVAWHPLGQVEQYIDISSSGTLSLELEFTPTSPVTYDENTSKPNPFGIDLVGDSQIAPTVELQKWQDLLVLPGESSLAPSIPEALP